MGSLLHVLFFWQKRSYSGKPDKCMSLFHKGNQVLYFSESGSCSHPFSGSGSRNQIRTVEQ